MKACSKKMRMHGMINNFGQRLILTFLWFNMVRYFLGFKCGFAMDLVSFLLSEDLENLDCVFIMHEVSLTVRRFVTDLSLTLIVLISKQLIFSFILNKK